MPYIGRNNETEAPILGKGSKMTPLMRRFVDEFMVDLKGSEAVLRAGYKISPGNAKRLAVELRNHPLVYAEIEKRMEKKAKKSEIHAEHLTEKLLEIIEDTQKDNPQACLRAIELAGKAIALWKDKQEISGPDGQAIEIKQKTEEDVADFRSKLAGIAARGRTGEVSSFPKP